MIIFIWSVRPNKKQTFLSRNVATKLKRLASLSRRCGGVRLPRVGLCQLFQYDRESEYLPFTRRSPYAFLRIRLASVGAARPNNTSAEPSLG